MKRFALATTIAILLSFEGSPAQAQNSCGNVVEIVGDLERLDDQIWEIERDMENVTSWIQRGDWSQWDLWQQFHNQHTAMLESRTEMQGELGAALNCLITPWF